MSKFYQGLLFLHGHIADPRILADAPKAAAPAAAKPATTVKPSRAPRKRSYGNAPRAA